MQSADKIQDIVGRLPPALTDEQNFEATDEESRWGHVYTNRLQIIRNNQQDIQQRIESSGVGPDLIPIFVVPGCSQHADAELTCVPRQLIPRSRDFSRYWALRTEDENERCVGTE
jgi:hypothetical protein